MLRGVGLAVMLAAWVAAPARAQEPSPPSSEAEARAVAVVDAATYDIDPVVGEHVTRRMRLTASDMGYRVLEREPTVEAARRSRMPFPPSPADLWRLTYAAGADRGAFARVWAAHGEYVVEIVVASLDGAGPFFARGTSGAPNLHAVVERLMRQALPPPRAWDAQAAERWSGRAGGAPAGETPAAPEGAQASGAERGPSGRGEPSDPSEPAAAEGPSEAFYDQRPPASAPPEEADADADFRRFELALQTEGAIGTSSDNFYNHLFGVRLGFRFTEDTILGAYVGYVNLHGRNGRANNVLPYVQVEHRVRVSDDSRVSIPLRFALGYLPFNGPVVRIGVGVNVPFGERFEIGFDLLTPTFWVLPDRTAVSLDLAAELIIRL